MYPWSMYMWKTIFLNHGFLKFLWFFSKTVTEEDLYILVAGLQFIWWCKCKKSEQKHNLKKIHQRIFQHEVWKAEKIRSERFITSIKWRDLNLISLLEYSIIHNWGGARGEYNWSTMALYIWFFEQATQVIIQKKKIGFCI